ncbi:hypothetical protein GGX14DRAFT_570623 [Mycena pura]|uniref:Uncharacterized protein n=1 Tax=Mycena pura TaxID=153505 RepID=A0AAD6YCJ7_9AGAR|nr:hypothetical protein GGX14DRAFT_570623 [Mycena pura]
MADQIQRSPTSCRHVRHVPRHPGSVLTVSLPPTARLPSCYGLITSVNPAHRWLAPLLVVTRRRWGSSGPELGSLSGGQWKRTDGVGRRSRLAAAQIPAARLEIAPQMWYDLRPSNSWRVDAGPTVDYDLCCGDGDRCAHCAFAYCQQRHTCPGRGNRKKCHSEDAAHRLPDGKKCRWSEDKIEQEILRREAEARVPSMTE